MKSKTCSKNIVYKFKERTEVIIYLFDVKNLAKVIFLKLVSHNWI